MTYVDNMLACQAVLSRVSLKPHVQLVFLWLVMINNDNRYKGHFYLSDADLKAMSNIRQSRQITEAKRELRKLGVIEFETQEDNPRRKTRYVLRLGVKDGVKTRVKTRVKSSGKASCDADFLAPQSKEIEREKEKEMYKEKETELASRPEQPESTRAQNEGVPDFEAYADLKPAQEKPALKREEPDFEAYADLKPPALDSKDMMALFAEFNKASEPDAKESAKEVTSSATKPEVDLKPAQEKPALKREEPDFEAYADLKPPALDSKDMMALWAKFNKANEPDAKESAKEVISSATKPEADLKPAQEVKEPEPPIEAQEIELTDYSTKGGNDYGGEKPSGTDERPRADDGISTVRGGDGKARRGADAGQVAGTPAGSSRMESARSRKARADSVCTTAKSPAGSNQSSEGSGAFAKGEAVLPAVWARRRAG